MEDRLNAKLTFTNKANKVTASAEVNDLSIRDAAALQVELLAALQRVAQTQVESLSK